MDGILTAVICNSMKKWAQTTWFFYVQGTHTVICAMCHFSTVVHYTSGSMSSEWHRPVHQLTRLIIADLWPKDYLKSSCRYFRHLRVFSSSSCKELDSERGTSILINHHFVFESGVFLYIVYRVYIVYLYILKLFPAYAVCSSNEHLYMPKRWKHAKK